MNADRPSYFIPIPFGLRPDGEAFDPVPFSAAMGQAVNFGWRKVVGRNLRHAEVDAHVAREPARPARRSRRS